MRPDIFDTASFPIERQLDAWRSWWSGFEPERSAVAADGFAAVAKVWQVHGLTFARVKAPPLRAVRSKLDIRREAYDHWNIVVGTKATTKLIAGTDRLLIPPHVPFVVSLGEEVISDRDADDRLQLYLPRDRFCELGPLLDSARNIASDTPMRRLLADYMLSLDRRLPELESRDLPRLALAIGAMVAACIEPSPHRLGAAASQIDFTRFEKVRQATRAHIRSPELGPALLCRIVGTSRSQLYRMFEGEGGVRRWIQRQRLLASHAMLSDATFSDRIGTIAETLCFGDSATFSRAFRREFGLTPTEVREAALAGVAHFPVMNDRSPPVGSRLTDFLRPF